MTKTVEQLPATRFPSLLNEIADPPEKLYIRGELPETDHYLTVVGSRRPTNYALDACAHLLSGLRGYPVTIVSGLAHGIDTKAHKEALSAGLPTVAVPGSGIDDSVLYPSSNRALAKEILGAGGCILSEYEPLFQATPWSFPKRNRIMAGMSHATLIVEARERSGTLITARLAMEYNRDVCAIPGSIFSNAASGSRFLIKNGAHPVATPEDILAILGIEAEETSVSRNFNSLSADERLIVESLREPMDKEELIELLEISPTEINIALSSLELKGHVEERAGMLRLR